MSRKRSIQEVNQLDEIDNPVPSTIIHGVVTSLSSIKRGRTTNYFDGNVSDGTAKLRLVGFNSSQQKALKELMDNKQPVQFSDCQIKQARRGNDMEVMLKGTTQIAKSPKKFDLSRLDFEDNHPVEIKLDDINTLNVYDRVTVTVKVVSLADVVDVTGGKRMQDVFVADSSGVCRVTLWEENIGVLKNNECYELQNFFVKEYSGTKFLSTTKEGCKIRLVPDIGHVKPYENEENDETIMDATMIAVLQLDTYKTCLRCKARVEPVSPPLGRCSKFECSMLQRFDMCVEHISAKLLFICNSKTYSLYAYGQIVQNLAENPCVTEEALLKSAKLKSITFNGNHVITSFER